MKNFKVIALFLATFTIKSMAQQVILLDEDQLEDLFSVEYEPEPEYYDLENLEYYDLENLDEYDLENLDEYDLENLAGRIAGAQRAAA